MSQSYDVSIFSYSFNSQFLNNKYFSIKNMHLIFSFNSIKMSIGTFLNLQHLQQTSTASFYYFMTFNKDMINRLWVISTKRTTWRIKVSIHLMKAHLSVA